MSRSYRKPYWTEGYGGVHRRIAKRQAAKQVRKAKFVGNSAYYKRLYNSWDICDFKIYGFSQTRKNKNPRSFRGFQN
jgi:hypothetical protein